MKITLQPSDSEALEVIIRGNLSDPQIPQIIAALLPPRQPPACFYIRKTKNICVLSKIFRISKLWTENHCLYQAGLYGGTQQII